MVEGSPKRLPFTFNALGATGRLALAALTVGPLVVDKLELEVTDLGTDPGAGVAERFQRRRTRLRTLVVRVTPAALEERATNIRRHLAGLGVTQLTTRLSDGFVSIRARAADGLAAADLSFRVQLVNTGTHLRALASTVRVHGALPAPGPVIADRILVALLGATDVPGVVDRPHARGLCDIEIDLIGGLLWQLMPPSGWRLPAVAELELVQIKITRAAIEVGYAPVGSRTGDLGVRPQAHRLAAAHDLMHSVDQQLRDGHLEEAMRGYRALLAAGGPEQPLLLERILALASARPPWFFDGLELARQALGRWPGFPAAHAALAAITLAQGDAREAASHLAQLAQLASADGDDDQAALAALAGARLLRVLEPKSATQLYTLALEHDPGSVEAADSLADRLADEHRWPELVRLVRARAAIATDVMRVVAARLRLADVLVHHLDDPAGAQAELTAARDLAPDDPAIYEMTAKILETSDRPGAVAAWRAVARLSELRSDHRTCARAHAQVATLLPPAEAEVAWQKALELDPLQAEAIAGLAGAAQQRGDHALAAELYERLRGLGLPQQIAARYELALARSLVALGRTDDARGSLRRATVSGGETAAEAHAVLAEIADATFDREHAAVELETAIAALVELAAATGDQPDRLYARAAQLAATRAALLDRTGQAAAATTDWARAHMLAQDHAPDIARDAARTMLDRSDDGITERRWIDAVLATRPPGPERAALLVRRADVRRKERTPDLAAALADLHEALSLTEDDDAELAVTRRRAYALEAELLRSSGDRRARAQALASLAKMSERAGDRIAVETAAAAAWLEADEPAAALPHGARAHAAMDADVAHRLDVPAALRREVLITLGEAAWRQRAWPDVIRAYRGLTEDTGAETARLGTFRYRLAVAADRTGDAALAMAALRPLADGDDANGTTPENRAQALRLFADLAERAGDLAGAAHALEGFASLAVDGAVSARADAMYRAGELFRRAERIDDAIRCLEAALRISDTHLPALDALELAWRERGDLERVSVILGRKVAATSRHPQRQKPLLSRLGDLQHQLERPDVALAAHQRALEIDPGWRPSLRYVTRRLGEGGDLVAAVGGYVQLAGELPSDSGVDVAILVRERQQAAADLAELVASLPDNQLDSVRAIALPMLERTSVDVGAALKRLRGERAAAAPGVPEENTASGRPSGATGSALSLRDGAARALAQGRLDEAFATLETANHVSPGDPAVLRELVDLATRLGDHGAAARHLEALAALSSGTRKGDTLLELADVLYDRLEDPARARDAMRAAADAFGSGQRRDATLRMLANEASTHLAWNVAVVALSAIAPERHTAPDVLALATALVRAGRDGEGVALLEEASRSKKLDAPELLHQLRAEVERKAGIAANLDARADMSISPADAEQMRAEAAEIRAAIREADIIHEAAAPVHEVSITVSGTAAEADAALALAAASADREQLIAAWRAAPDDAGLLLAVLAHLADREPALRREILDDASKRAGGRARAVALHELAELARRDREPIRAQALWAQAHETDPSYPPVWMPLADSLAAADDIEAARHFYEQVAVSDAYPLERRTWAKERAETLGKDHSIVSGEIRPRSRLAKDLQRAIELAEKDDLPGAIAAAQAALETAPPGDTAALELLERLYLETGDITAASEAIGRQLVVADQPLQRAALWRRRARLYRDALGRDAEAYRCLKEAHACSPADPEVAYQLRTAAMVRGEWGLVASLLYREIASATHPRDRGALHLELALIFEQRLDDVGQAQVNFEQALAFDPTIPAAKLPLAKRYEAIGRHADAARLYDEAAAAARPADRGGLLEAAARCRRAVAAAADDPASQLERAEAAGDTAAALELAHQVWRAQPGHATAFRVLASSHRTAGDLASLTEITSARASRSDKPDDRAAIWIDVARLAEETGALDQAARAYDLALIEDPGHVGALDARGALAFRLGDFATAELIYRDLRAGESVLGDDELALRRSIIAQELGRDGDALALANAAAASAPNRRDILLRVQELATRTGDLPAAITAARAVLDLVPLADEETQILTQFSLVDLLRAAGDLDAAAKQLERVVREHPHHGRALEQLAEVHMARGDWPTATRYLYQLVPLAPSAVERAERLFRLGEAVLVHLGDVDRADDVFLRASDLDPSHIPTLRRLLDVYWRADDPGGLVEVAGELAGAGALSHGAASDASLAHALIAAALVGDTALAGQLGLALGDEAPRRIVAALGELQHREGRLQLGSAGMAVAELARRGLLDLAKVRAAAAGTPVEPALQS